LQGRLHDYFLYALLAPHICNCGYGGNGWAGNYKDIPMLFAERAGTSLALACSMPFHAMSCGYVGTSDGWQDISRNKRMTWFYMQALNGNIVLTGEVSLSTGRGDFVLALAFGRSAADAGQLARAALLQNFEDVVRDYIRGWQSIQNRFIDFGTVPRGGFDLYRTSTAVLKTHESATLPGGIIASLSIPWGSSKGDEDLGGYHLVWRRDLVESAGDLLAAGDGDGACSN
jgi:glucoamylase